MFVCALAYVLRHCVTPDVEEGGFERAAQRLSITQSAVSQRLRRWSRRSVRC
ncbi:LysR family transcriptional regulator [Polaromonas sp.]|uniref:LysR family transcriptional regulator n=1 Tax=Polaromonas sp. TaxID=1869339 RepID=UPI002D1F9D09|nr:LysR family transcriptional regulator [Polaromonas sp.]